MRRSNNMFRKQLLLQIIQLAAMRYDNPNIHLAPGSQDPANWFPIYDKEAGGPFQVNEFFKNNFLTAFINHLN